MLIFPSLISSDILNLHSTLERLDQVSDGYHIDIMDGHFVPSLTWGPPFFNAIAKVTQKPCHAHLMVTNPSSIATQCTFNTERGDLCFVHYESLSHLLAVQIQKELEMLTEKEVPLGIALNPDTPPQVIEPFIKIIKAVLIMSVLPGASGQTFMPQALETARALRALLPSSIFVCMDGGIGPHQMPLVQSVGVMGVAAASSIFFHSQGDVEGIQALRKSIE